MQKLPISVTILVKNAQSTFSECLSALVDFDEVIVLDNGSDDGTLDIAKKFANVKIYQSEFIGFGALKNLAISYATHEWILSVDSDEILESSTLEQIRLALSSMQPHHIYAMPRKNLYNGEWIKACGWYPDYVWRLFNKTFTRFNDNIIHESVILPKNAKLIKLTSGLKHYAFRDISHLLDKLQRYSSLWAKQHSFKRSSPLKALTHGLWTFVRNYLFKKGILYGYKGFAISVCNGLGAFFKYLKLYELGQTPPTCSLIITTYNQKERLALVLDSVKNLAFLPNEVLIADDGSLKDTKELIENYQKSFPCPLKHIWQKDDGFRLSEIRNKAIKAASGAYIIIIDGDMILHPHFVKDHLHFAKKGAFIQGSRVILNEKNTQEIMDSLSYHLAFKYGDMKAKKIPLLAKMIFATSTIKASYFDKRDFIKGIRGCNMGFYKADCVAINGFSEEFIGWGREDSEFVARFLFNGGEMRRLKFSAIAYHLYHKENTRSMLESNHAIYLRTIQNKSTFCQKGLKS
ncbi:putative two-domain glycosyltransferase [Helicobacter cinaedi]|uniref:Putative two-domain glycosyltransferase n=1 Tax=Helicobacter cinaedi TaxID=213 RepID=A0A377JR73_9HELI|nr:glycosyltransferase [Helicobacter cinaedi]STP10438.1 putative two-domain glycosyltransferase [Helicobacter cinaedi]